MTTPSDQFPTDTAGLPASRPTEVVDVPGGGRVELRVAPVTKQIGDATVRMLAYNGSIPGPTLRVRQDSEIDVDVVNEGDMDATVHWHGLRLDNRFDGTHETQAPIPVGGRFTSRVAFPDPGVYWYHPHIREDYGQEMGLYGNVLVESPDPDYWGPAHRELVLTLDDILIEDGQVAAFSQSETNYAAMGRFGNVLLVAGEPEPRADREERRSRPRVPDEHREHARVQGQAAGRADEARGRRQRPRRARGVRRGGRAGAVRARRRARAVRRARTARARAPHTRAHLHAGVGHGQRGARGAVAGGGVRHPAQRSGARGGARAPRSRSWTPSPTRRWRSWPRWSSRRRRARSSTPARCIRTSSARSRAAARCAG